MDLQHFDHPDFAIDVPADWMAVPSPKFEAVFVMPPFPEGAGINLAVSIIKPAEPTTLGTVINDLRAVQQADYPAYHLHHETMVDLPKQAGFVQFYSWTNTDDQIAIAQAQVIFLAPDGLKVGILTLTRPADVPEDAVKAFDDLLYVMASSFELI